MVGTHYHGASARLQLTMQQAAKDGDLRGLNI